MGAWSKYYKALLLLWLCVQLLPSRVGCQPSDNLTVCNELIDAIANTIFERLPKGQNISILIRSPYNSPNDTKLLVENGIIKNFFQRGLTTIYLEKSDSIPTFILDYQILDFSVNYARGMQKKFIQRGIKLHLKMRATEGRSGQVLWVDEFQQRFEDQVRTRDVSNLEHSSIPLTQGKLPEQNGLRVYLEPMIITAATATIIYLFFRLRSK
ncbi:MAG: hypothetical protein ONB31_10650 [candidate division KSB1 bacterium]|nr:hypothetical protein [candidate division KSB1 bacterium]MDZ7333894.1 hypothetical protein [candidate division KSB1 bacterium]MDZ7358339.1 hypothetical protein [candidate division KSB1 bacterium]MDZ7399140.1 hypothetical protein [candidate division KSB1 bacterium]